MAGTILTPIQKAILSFLAQDVTFKSHFYLTGGTALSEYYLHHRLSEDLDFFSQSEVDNIWLNSIAAKLAGEIRADKKDIQQSFNRNLVFFTVGSQLVKIEFTCFPMLPIQPPQVIEGMPIDSELDIAVNKFFTIYQKPSARHFIDLYLLVTAKNYSWDDIRKLARSKFDTHIDPLQLGSQLVKAGEVADLPHMLIDLPDSQWREYFLKKAGKLKSELSGGR